MELHPPHHPGVQSKKKVLAEPTWDFASNRATGMKLSLICLNFTNFLHWATIATQEPPLGHMNKCRLFIRNVGSTTDIIGNGGCLLEMVVDQETF